MQPSRMICAVAALSVLLCLQTFAATKPTEVLKPYLDAHTCCVVEIDLTRTKPDDISKWAESILRGSKVEKAEAAQKTLTGDLLPQAQKMVDNLRKAGAKRVYWVGSITDMRSDPFFMVIPLEENANEEKLLKQLPENSVRAREKIGDALVSGPPATIARLKDLEAADQPELEKAFEVIGDAPIRAALCVLPELRAIMQQAPIPQARELFDNLNWLAAAIQLPPHPGLKAIGQAQDNESAEKAATAADELITMLKDDEELNSFEALRAQLEEIKPKADNDQVVLGVDEAKMRSLSEALAPAIVAARMQANRVKSASNERQIIQALLLYANENNGAYPDDLHAVVNKYLDDRTGILINPAATGDDDGYSYIRPSEGNTAPADRLMIYEKFDEFPEAGINVGFADGHVELVTDKDAFDKMLQDAKDNAAEQKK
jgi:prepilin-type processing-associated H-X9-DG protein